MRLLALLLLFSCSTSVTLKYKYSSQKRYLASLTREDVVVHRIEGELQKDQIFASGMDSTILSIRLFDKHGNLLTDVDPGDLTLSSTEDIEAKTFVRKQGVYKAHILPRVKSRTIVFRVDWLEKVFSDDLILNTTVSPLKDKLVPLTHEYFQSNLIGEINIMRGSATSESSTDSFSLENMGDNRIVNSGRFKYSQRVFDFTYPEQARQNLALEVDDIPNEIVSHTMHSIFMLFPRKYLPTIEQKKNTFDVTLPTGEKMIFNRESKEIVGGVFTEGPLDNSTNRHKRHYPDLQYQGRGVILRVNARGQSPQLGQFENTKIDMDYGKNGSLDVLIINGTTGEKCRRPKSDFWEPIDVNPIEFKYPSDEEFDIYLRTNCGFGIPNF